MAPDVYILRCIYLPTLFHLRPAPAIKPEKEVWLHVTNISTFFHEESGRRKVGDSLGSASSKKKKFICLLRGQVRSKWKVNRGLTSRVQGQLLHLLQQPAYLLPVRPRRQITKKKKKSSLTLTVSLPRL